MGRKYEIFVEILKDTPGALMVTNGDITAWFPKLLIEMDQDGGPGDGVILTMSESLAIDKGFL